MRRSQPKYGAIHTDGAAKVMTLLVYMNDEWDAPEAGRLRVLYDGERYEPYAVEVPPTMGTMFEYIAVWPPPSCWTAVYQMTYAATSEKSAEYTMPVHAAGEIPVSGTPFSHSSANGEYTAVPSAIVRPVMKTGE